jgi:uncharacterized protein
MPDRHALVPRHAQALVSEALADTRVVLLNGARQAGKSTLTRLVANDRPGTVIRLLDDPATLQAAQDDPTGFVDHDELMVIDEIQFAPGLLRAIKLTVDLDPTPGRFLLTGSSRVLALRTLPDALPGRMEIIELWPFSQGEMTGGPDRFVDVAFRHGPTVDHSSDLRRKDYLERVVMGGFPEAVRRAPRRRAAFFDSYLATLIERDVLELSNIERRGELLKLLALLAGRAGHLLIPGTLAGQSGIPRTTLVRYIELLSSVFLVKSVPAWASNLTQRAVGTPKLAFVDTSLACHLIGQDAARLGEPGGAAGPMMENFVVMELARQLTWSEERGTLYHYRTKDGVEVDAVIETPDGRVIGVEVKAGATVRTEDLTGLRSPRQGPRRPFRRWLRPLHRPADAAVRGEDPSSTPGRALASPRVKRRCCPPGLPAGHHDVETKLFHRLPDEMWFYRGTAATRRWARRGRHCRSGAPATGSGPDSQSVEVVGWCCVQQPGQRHLHGHRVLAGMVHAIQSDRLHGIPVDHPVSRYAGSGVLLTLDHLVHRLGSWRNDLDHKQEVGDRQPDAPRLRLGPQRQVGDPATIAVRPGDANASGLQHLLGWPARRG